MIGAGISIQVRVVIGIRRIHADHVDIAELGGIEPLEMAGDRLGGVRCGERLGIGADASDEAYV